MRFVLPFVAAILPVVIAPGMLFYFDVTPKVVILLMGTAIALLLWRGDLALQSRRNRILFLLLAAEFSSLIASSIFSTFAPLSMYGGNWRRFGFISHGSILLFAALAATDAASDRARAGVYLKAIALGSIPVALYAVLQYFGWDPWLPKQSYHAGEDTWSIVRPPSTMGHAGYLATYLLFAVFACAGLWRERQWRIAVCIAAALAGTAIVLSGTRAALLGLVAGLIAFGWGTIRVEGRKVAIGGAAALTIFSVFYFSPLGKGLRNRVTWSSNEPLGGARPLLWRDSLRMALHRPILGYGPETFVRDFPKRESIELARAYPDFLHESPHNMFLDALDSQGIIGLLLLIAFCVWGFVGARDLPWARGALAGSIVSLLFTVWIVPTALFFYLFLALLASPGETRRFPLLRFAACCAALLLLICAARLATGDRALFSAVKALDRGDLASSQSAYLEAEKWSLPGSSADLYYSRRLADFVRSTPNFELKSRALAAATESALRAPATSEETANAWYNLAAFLSMANAPADVERCLRESIAAAPNWYKPHWVLAQLLIAEHRMPEAEPESEIAVRCNPKALEVLHTLENIRAARRQ